MTESNFTQSIHRLLPQEVYKWKINDRFTSGIPDSYYSGQKNDLWIEYKFIKELPVKRLIPKLSQLQLQWLNARYSEGRNVAVIVGSPQGSILFKDKEWIAGKQPINFMSKRDVAHWITTSVA